MKKLRNFLLILLVLPLCFVFSSCKKNESGGDGGNGSNPSNPETPTVVTYSVSFDYNLPDGYEGLLNNYVVSNKEVGSQTTLAKVSDSKLAPYFLGWTEEGSEEFITGTVTSATNRVIKLQGKWDISNLNKYYFSDGLNYEFGTENVKITGYTGSRKNVIIPKVIKGDGDIDYPVTEIAESAFADCDINKVVMNVYGVSVGANAFKNTNLAEIDFNLINSIGESAFENTKLKNVKFSTILRSIGNASFKGCLELESVDFNNISVDFSNEMFSGCERLTTITNTTNTKNVGDYAFFKCSSLDGCDFISGNAEFIGEKAFAGCFNIKKVSIPNSVLNVYGGVFDDCANLKDLTLSRLFLTIDNGSDNLFKHIGNAVNIEKITLTDENVSKLVKNYFDGLVNLKTFIMCDSIAYIESNTFRECAKLENITLSNNIVVNSFSINAFNGTKFLKDMNEPFVYSNAILYVPETIPAEYSILEGVLRINNNAFKNNNSIQKITIPSTVEFIGVSAFEGCKNLTEVVFSENNVLSEISNKLFYGCSNLSTIDLTRLTTLTKIGNDSFRSSNIANFVVPATVTKIGSNAFSYAQISSFSVSGESEKFVCEDGVLFEKNGENRTLVAYPVLKTDSMYIVPETVNAISSHAFLGAFNLKNIYFTQSAISWGYSGTDAERTYNVFENTFGIKLFSENNQIKSTELEKNYYLISQIDYEYDAETDTITFVDEFQMTNKYNFIKYYDGQKINLIYFELQNNDDGTVSIVNGSISKLETSLLK